GPTRRVSGTGTWTGAEWCPGPVTSAGAAVADAHLAVPLSMPTNALQWDMTAQFISASPPHSLERGSRPVVRASILLARGLVLRQSSIIGTHPSDTMWSHTLSACSSDRFFLSGELSPL